MASRIAYFLLAPIAPLIGWGPITHIYLHKKAIDALDGDGPDGVLQRDDDKREFINASNIADLIKANQLRHKERYYEYAHNTIPTKFEGQPVLGERLWVENRKRGRRDGMVYSLGWLCHQVSDQFPHRFPTNGYEGFVNARLFFGQYYPVDEEDWSEPTRILRNDLISTDHWLTEIFTDMLCLTEEIEFFRSYKIDLDFGDYPELEQLTAKIIEDYYDDLYPAVKYFIPLKPAILKRIYRYYHTLISVFLDLHFHFYEKFGPYRIRELIGEFKPLDDLQRMLDFSHRAIMDAIGDPGNGWNPDKYKDPDPGPVLYSVYSYENYDGPERYDFGFKRGVIPWVAGLFSNNQMLNEIARNYADKYSTWSLVRPVMGFASKRGRSGMNLTAYFMRELDASPEKSLDELIENTARRFKLKKGGA